MIERLSDLLSAQRVFIAHAAHELRSPLSALYGELALALRRSRDADEYRARHPGGVRVDPSAQGPGGGSAGGRAPGRDAAAVGRSRSTCAPRSTKRRRS